VRKSSPTSLQALADKVGVSVSTVSRVLSGQSRLYRISPQTAERILEKARQLRVSPNPLALGLKINKTLTIGLVIPDISNPFFAGIARSVEIEAGGRGYATILCDTQDDTAREGEAIRVLRSRKVEGLVICPVGQSDRHLREFESDPIPVVLADRYFPDLKVPYVASDNYRAAYRATNHLLGHGHRRIACIQGLGDTTPNLLRVRGYRQALIDHGVAYRSSLVVGDSFSQQNGYAQTRRLLEKHPDLTAIFSLSNLIALGVLRALAEERLSVPKDISVLCFDDQPYCAFLATPMTTVEQKTPSWDGGRSRCCLNGSSIPNENPARGSCSRLA
jgi:LacI family transcriptional regulator